MGATFIRHGQSIGNVGIPSHNLSAIELTGLGYDQARGRGRVLEETPNCQGAS